MEEIDSSNFSLRGYLPLIQKYSVTHMHGPAFYKGLTFALDLSLTISGYSYLECYLKFLFMFLTGFDSFRAYINYFFIPLLITIYLFEQGF